MSDSVDLKEYSKTCKLCGNTDYICNGDTELSEIDSFEFRGWISFDGHDVCPICVEKINFLSMLLKPNEVVEFIDKSRNKS